MASQGPHECQLVLGLDALRHDDRSQRRADLDDRAQQGRRLLVADRALDERLGDLEAVDRERTQVAQRAVAGAEVVDDEMDAAALQLVEDLTDPRAVRDDGMLGDLEDERIGRDAGRHHGLADVLAEPGLVELESREIDHHREPLLARERLPLAELSTGGLEDPATDAARCRRSPRRCR